MGPRPYQCGLPSLMVTGEKQRWLTTPACSATSDRLSAQPGQGAHDQPFVVVIGMGALGERGHGQRFNGVVIGACFEPNDDVHRFLRLLSFNG